VKAGERVEHGTRRRRRAGLTLSINVSPDRLAHPELLQDVARVLESYAMSPALLSELSEVGLMNLFARDHKVRARPAGLGVKLAFDDFSAAATSLDYLQRFQVDVVKVDRSLVRGLGQDDNHGEDSTVRGHHLHRAHGSAALWWPKASRPLSRPHTTSARLRIAQGFPLRLPASLYSSRRGCSP